MYITHHPSHPWASRTTIWYISCLSTIPFHRSGNKEEMRRVQKELRRNIREGNRKRMEGQLQQNNTIGVWRGLKTISGFKESNRQLLGNLQLANDLNSFFNRFDRVADPPSAQLTPLLSAPSIQPCAPLPLTREQELSKPQASSITVPARSALCTYENKFLIVPEQRRPSGT
ncbi:hypothetical protein SRHO_G00269690 [Serrasalmus rhombeus]